MNKRIESIFSFILILYFSLTFLIVFVNIEKGNKKEYSENRKEYSTILDKDGRVIVMNLPIYEVWTDLNFMRRTKKFEKLKPFLLKFVKEKDLNRNFVKIGSFENYDDIMYKIPESILNFSNIYKTTLRYYNKMFSLDKLIGMYDKTVYGIEPYLYEKGLLKEKENIKLSIDLKFQRIAYEELKKVIDAQNAEGGTVIIMETKTGKLRAVVSIYDWNLAFMGYVEPGSTFKPIIFSIALEEGVISPYQMFNCPAYIKPLPNLNYVIYEAEKFAFGKIDVKEALIHSSNVAAVKVMKALLKNYSNDWIYRRLKALGLGEKTGVEFKGEIPGVFRDVNKWYEITPYQIAIGQGIGTTPIQLISIFNALINDGIYVKPSLLEDSQIFRKRLFTVDVSRLMKEFLSYTVIRGTARKAFKPGIMVAGKTGTAQKAIAGKGYSERYFSLFVGFYPAAVPKYTILVIIDDPKHEIYGGEVAAPIATNIFYRVEEYNLVKNHEKIIKDHLPIVVGKTFPEAMFILKESGIDLSKVKIKGKGLYIIDQFPKEIMNIKNVKFLELQLGDEKP